MSKTDRARRTGSVMEGMWGMRYRIALMALVFALMGCGSSSNQIPGKIYESSDVEQAWLAHGLNPTFERLPYSFYNGVKENWIIHLPQGDAVLYLFVYHSRAEAATFDGGFGRYIIQANVVLAYRNGGADPYIAALKDLK